MATDSKKNAVSFGDYLIVDAVPTDKSGVSKFTGIVRIVKLSETPKGTSAIGAFVDLVGNGRVQRMPVDVSKARLVLKADGSEVAS